MGYGARLCPYWDAKDTLSEYSRRCPFGLRCPYSHGAKERLYHPRFFRTVHCRDLKDTGSGGKVCPRQSLCVFFHGPSEKRARPDHDDVDYSQALPAEALPDDIMDFLLPPPLPEGGRHGTAQDHEQEGGDMQVAPQMM